MYRETEEKKNESWSVQHFAENEYTHTYEPDTVNYRDLLNHFIKKSFFARSLSLCVNGSTPINYLGDYGFLLLPHSFIRLNGTRC